MDLDAVLARQPSVALVDELAHTNVPGSGRHEKRWQDVLEILEAGIDVITTVNIQHLESIADAVEQMTGTPVRERVPDWVVRKADQIELVDSSPEQLRRRMLHGNIYPEGEGPAGADPFLPTDNLDRPSRARAAVPCRRDRRGAARAPASPASQRSVGDHRADHGRRDRRAGDRSIVRRAARIAARVKGELTWYTSRAGTRSRRDGPTIAALRDLAADLGARLVRVARSTDPARALIDFAKDQQITQIVIGSSQRSRWQELTGGGSIVRRILREAGVAGIDVHVIARREQLPQEVDDEGEDGGSD